MIRAITQTGTATAKYPSAKFCFPKIAGNAEAIPIEVIIPNPKNKLQTDIIDARKLVVQLSPAIIAYKSPFDQSAPNTIPKNNPIRKVGHLKYNPTNYKTKAIVADDNKIIDVGFLPHLSEINPYIKVTSAHVNGNQNVTSVAWT